MPVDVRVWQALILAAGATLAVPNLLWYAERYLRRPTWERGLLALVPVALCYVAVVELGRLEQLLTGAPARGGALAALALPLAILCLGAAQAAAYLWQLLEEA